MKDHLESIKESPGCFYKLNEENENKEKSSEEANKSGNEDEINENRDEFVDKNFLKKEVMTDGVLEAGEEDISAKDTELYSSVWCHDGSNQVCQFENICYNFNADEFVLFKHESSIFENVIEEHGSITLDLSSVKDHNGMETSVVSLPSTAFSSMKTKWINETTIVFKPFLSDNLMHMFHDDIIPLHHTLKLLTMGDPQQKANHPFKVQLFIFDDDFDVDDKVRQFYEVFSKFKIKTKNDFEGSELTCFRNIFIGLSRAATWYDYGFTSPQGPVLDHSVESMHVRSTANYLRQHLPIPSRFSSQEYVVLFTRKENRIIINEMELTLKILKTIGIKVMNLNTESYTLLELISYTSYSKGVIAMHGSLLILSMFLTPGSFVIELFPYAINPSHYTPYKTLSQLKGMGLIYKAWTNQIKENSIGHPDWPPESGGLFHLEEDKRETILHQTEVPQHLCCKDPSWLFHIYQDTVVNSSEILALIQEAMSESLLINKVSTNSGILLHPSKVRNVSCHSSHTGDSGKQFTEENNTHILSVKWDVPWTTSYIKFESLRYEILSQCMDTETEKTLTFKSATNKLVINSDCSGKCYVWVRAVIDDHTTGLYSKATFCQPVPH